MMLQGNLVFSCVPAPCLHPFTHLGTLSHPWRTLAPYRAQCKDLWSSYFILQMLKSKPRERQLLAITYIIKLWGSWLKKRSLCSGVLFLVIYLLLLIWGQKHQRGISVSLTQHLPASSSSNAFFLLAQV